MTSPLTPRQGGDGRYFHGEDYEGMGRRFNVAVFGSIGALAGWKFYERWKSPYTSAAELLGASMRHGAIMAIRWKAWTVTAVWWLITTPVWIVLASGILDTALDEHSDGWATTVPPKDIDVTGPWFHGSLALVWAILALHVVIGFFAIGVTYNRHIRESEFKQRWFFRMMAPLEPLVERIDWKILTSLVVVPVALAIVSYNQ
jgi:hypothetical protein